MKLPVALTALAMCAAIGLASCRPAGDGAASSTAADSTSVSASAEAAKKDEEVRGVTVGEARELLEKGEAALVDVRTEVQYREGHIRGALLMPKDSLQARMNELPADRLIVCYCACPAEHLSLEASRAMRRGGRQNVAVLVGGLRAWIKEGLPTESGTAGGNGRP